MFPPSLECLGGVARQGRRPEPVRYGLGNRPLADAFGWYADGFVRVRESILDEQFGLPKHLTSVLIPIVTVGNHRDSIAKRRLGSKAQTGENSRGQLSVSS